MKEGMHHVMRKGFQQTICIGNPIKHLQKHLYGCAVINLEVVVVLFVTFASIAPLSLSGSFVVIIAIRENVHSFIALLIDIIHVQKVANITWILTFLRSYIACMTQSWYVGISLSNDHTFYPDSMNHQS